MNWKGILRDLSAPLVDLIVDGIGAATTKAGGSRSDEDLEELMKLAKETPKLELKEASKPVVPAPIMPKSRELKIKGREIPPGKKRLLDAMGDLYAAEEHLINKFPDLAKEIRGHRKKIEDTVL